MNLERRSIPAQSPLRANSEIRSKPPIPDAEDAAFDEIFGDQFQTARAGDGSGEIVKIDAKPRVDGSSGLKETARLLFEDPQVGEEMDVVEESRLARAERIPTPQAPEPLAQDEFDVEAFMEEQEAIKQGVKEEMMAKRAARDLASGRTKPVDVRHGAQEPEPFADAEEAQASIMRSKEDVRKIRLQKERDKQIREEEARIFAKKNPEFIPPQRKEPSKVAVQPARERVEEFSRDEVLTAAGIAELNPEDVRMVDDEDDEKTGVFTREEVTQVLRRKVQSYPEKKQVKIPELPKLAIDPRYRAPEKPKVPKLPELPHVSGGTRPTLYRTPAVPAPLIKDRVAIDPPKPKEATALQKFSAWWDRVNPFK